MTGRPRDPSIPEELRDCPIHGKVPFRRHKHGRRPDGAQRWHWVCVKCHAVKHLRGYHDRKESS